MKRKTVICDIDGCIFHHHGEGIMKQWDAHTVQLLPGVQEAFAQWESESTCVVLMTARPECLRESLEELLLENGCWFDNLVMGVGHGTRYLINDIKPEGDMSAVGINLPRNEGLKRCTRLS